MSVLVTINGRPTADSIDSKEDVTSRDGFHDARRFVCVCGEQFEAADFSLLNPRNLFPASDERLRPAWRTERKGYSKYLDPPVVHRIFTKPLPRSPRGYRQRFEDLCPWEVLILELLNDYEVWDQKLMSQDPVQEPWSPWVPEHPRIDWVTVKLAKLPKRLREVWAKRGLKTPATLKLPAVLVLPDWWSKGKDFGDRWEWNPTNWATPPSTSVVERVRAAEQRIKTEESQKAFIEWWREQLGEPTKFRPARFEGVSELERETRLILIWNAGARRIIELRRVPRLIIDPAHTESADVACDLLLKSLRQSGKKISSKKSYKALEHVDIGLAALRPALDELDKALKAAYPGTADTAGYILKDCFKPFVLKFPTKDPNSRMELVDRDPKHITQFDDKHRFQLFIPHAGSGGPSTSSVVAHGDFYKTLRRLTLILLFHSDKKVMDAVKMFRGDRVGLLERYLERHHGQCEHDGECEPPTQDLIKSNTAAIAAEVQASVESVLAERSAYEYLPRREWLDGQCEFRLIPKRTKPGHEVHLDKPKYASSDPNWIKFHSDPGKRAHKPYGNVRNPIPEVHKPNARFHLYDGYTGNKPEDAFVQVNLEHYKATGEIVREQVDFKKAERPTKEQLQWAKEVTGIPAEPRGEKFIKKKAGDEEGFDAEADELEDYVSHFSDDEESAPGYLEGFHITDEGGTKVSNPRDHDDLQGVRDLIDAKARAGEYCLPGDPKEAAIKKNGIEVNKMNKEFRRDSFIVEWIMTNATKDRTQEGEERWLAQAAARLQTTMDALYRRRQELLKRSRAMRSNGGSQVPDKPYLTYEQAVDIADRGATYVKVKLNDQAEWTWYRVDAEKHGSVAKAIEALKLAKMDKALGERLRKAGIGPDETPEQRPEINVIFKDVKDAYDKAFHIDRMRIAPARTKGLIGLIARFGGK